MRPKETETRSLPAVALAVRFIDCINLGDADALGEIMSCDHRLEVFDEQPVVGRDANVNAWRGYLEAFPNYVVYPREIAERPGVAVVRGFTTGSHLGLPDEEERKETLIWLAFVREGKVTRWCLVEDNDANRREYGLKSRS